MTRIAVTGVNGFVGRHLARELVDSGHSVIGIGQGPTAADPEILVDYVGADLAAGWPSIPPVDAVAHLAGLAAIGPSFDEPGRYVTENSAMVIHLFEALRAARVMPRVLVVSSGAVYDSKAPQPLTEQSSVDFTSPYVVSKVLVENLTAYYRGLGANAVVVRPFNHIGPGQGPGFLVPDLVATVRRAHESGEPPAFGVLTTRRDYTDVRDVVRAYRLLLEAPTLSHTLFNVCSGTNLAGTEILAVVQEVLGDVGRTAGLDPRQLRPQDPSSITGSHALITEAVGWQPQIDPQTSIRDYVETLVRGVEVK